MKRQVEEFGYHYQGGIKKSKNSNAKLFWCPTNSPVYQPQAKSSGPGGAQTKAKYHFHFIRYFDQSRENLFLHEINGKHDVI